MAKTLTSLLVPLLAVLVALTPGAAAAAPALAPGAVPLAAAAAAPPPRDEVLAAARSAVGHFYANNGGATANAGWRWAPFFMAVEALHRETGDPGYRQWLQAWGDRNHWTADAPVSPTSNPDARAAIQVWYDAAGAGVAADLGPSDRLMAADLGLPADQYWWIDAMFMGMPLWPRWAARTGQPAYGAKHAEFYDNLKHGGTTRWRPGCTATGLFDASEDLWWRDCKYVAQRDALGNKVFWARGNGWVLAAMARTLMVLPPSDPQAHEYRTMLQRMSARLAQLQGSDGMWRSSLLSPSLHPAPETSATALFTYAMAYGIRTGVLDRATYGPVVTRAWEGMTRISLKDSGFLSHCQGVGEAPAAPSTTTSIAYCVGAFGLAATEVARLGGDLASDTFSRSVTGGLGPADVGGRWTVTGTASRYAVSGGAAAITTPAGSTQYAFLDGVRSLDTDVRATVGFPRPTAGSVYVGVTARRTAAGSLSGRAVVSAAGGVQAQVQRSGVTLRAVAVRGLTFRPGDRLHLRVQAVGAAPTTLRAKVWAVGTSEPAGWQVSVTDATTGLQAAGGVGLSTYLSSGGSPRSVVVSVDDVVARRTS